MPRYPVNPARTVRAGSPAAVRTAWASGSLVGASKHQLVVRVRPGYIARAYTDTVRIDTGENVTMQTIVASPSQYPPWVGTWTPLGDWLTLPNIRSVQWTRSFDQNGSSTGTVVMDNIVFAEATGVAGVFHNIKRGYFSPSRGVVVGTRSDLWDDTGWTNKLNGGYQIEVWEGYGPDSDARCIPLATPTDNSCAPADALISRTWTGLIETVDLESHPDLITLTARDFGVLFTDQRVQGTNKAAEIVAPTTFADQSHSQGIRPVGLATTPSDFPIEFYDDFLTSTAFLSVTGSPAFTPTEPGGLVVSAPTTIAPNVYWQGGLLSFHWEGADLAGWTVTLPGVGSIAVAPYETGEITVTIQDASGTTLFTGNSVTFGSPVESLLGLGASGPSLVEIYWDSVGGVIALGVGVGGVGAEVFPLEVSGLPVPTSAVQPTLTLDAAVDGSAVTYTQLTINSDLPVRLPGDLLATDEAPNGAHVTATSVTSSYTGASTKNYDSAELWVSAIQTDPTTLEHIDVTIGRVYTPPARSVQGTLAALNESLLPGFTLYPTGDYHAELGPGVPAVLGTLTAALSTGAPITALPVTATTVGLLFNQTVSVVDPTGRHSQVFTAADVGGSAGTDVPPGSTSVNVASATPSYAFPIGSTVYVASTAPTYAGLGQFRLFTMTPLWSGCEMWVSLELGSDMLMDGKAMSSGWVDLGYGSTPEGTPFLLHTTLDFGTPGGPLTFDLGHVFDTNNAFVLNDDGSVAGLNVSASAIPGVTLRLTFRSLQSGAPITTPDIDYMTGADLTALEAALTTGNYACGVQSLFLFALYPWTPGTSVPRAALSAALSTASAITSLPVTALSGPISANTVLTLTASSEASFVGGYTFGVDPQEWLVTADAVLGATTIDVESQVPAFDYPAGSLMIGGEFLQAPLAGLMGGVGQLGEVDSASTGLGVAGDVNAVHWVLINDAVEIIEVLCKWAGFKEWSLDWFGWSVVNPMQYGSDKFFIDVVNDVLAQGNFVFYMDGPTDDDRSIGIPCFVNQDAVSAPPSDMIEVTDQNLLETAEVKWDLSSLPYVLRYRGDPVPPGTIGFTYEEDLVATFQGVYYPPWAGADYAPLDGSPPPSPPLRRTAGVVRHYTQTVGVNVPIGLQSNAQCLFAGLLAAMQYALGMGTGQVQIPGLDAFSLNQQISIIEEADGINSRMWLASVQSNHVMGPNGKWEMVLGGSYIDTEDMDLIVADYDYALTQVQPEQPSGERYIGIPTTGQSAAVDRWTWATGLLVAGPPTITTSETGMEIG